VASRHYSFFPRLQALGLRVQRHPPSTIKTHLDQVLLDQRHLLREAVQPEVAARDYDAVGLVQDALEVEEGLGVWWQLKSRLEIRLGDAVEIFGWSRLGGCGREISLGRRGKRGR
jgi:hypothetical protein